MTGTRRLHRASPRLAAALLGTLMVLGVGAGLLIGLITGPQWQSSTNALVQTWSVDSLLLTGQSSPVTTEDQADAAVFAVSQSVLTRAAADLADGRDWTMLAKKVTATPVPISHIVTITAKAPDRDTAVRTSEAVATAFAEVMRENLSAAAAGLTSTQAGENDASVKLRSQLLTWTLQPIQVFRTTQPEQLSPSWQTPVAFGIVGLAVGALVILVLSLTRPSVATARDAQRLLSLPAVEFSRPDGGPQTARLITQLLEANPRGTVLVCPVNADAEKAALEVVEWVHQRGLDDHDRVTLTPEPSGAVLAPRSRHAADAAVVLVVPNGTARQELTDAVTLLAPWQPTDAVIVTT